MDETLKQRKEEIMEERIKEAWKLVQKEEKNMMLKSNEFTSEEK